LSVQSCLYEGWVRHRRFSPVPHEFRYRLYMSFLDLDELPGVFRGRWLWSAERPAPVRFRREDHFGDPGEPLAESVRRLVLERTGRPARGPIRMLTNLRHLGYVFNPISIYYCYDPGGERVETVVGEVTNTPWRERHLYVLQDPKPRRARDTLRLRNGKEFHVSPFLPMDLAYDWRVTTPGERLAVHMDILREGRKILDATLVLKRTEITGAALARVLLRHTIMTATIIRGIHWQALRLWRKGVPVHPHPRSGDAGSVR
jgi:DUF1365 family protein